MNKIPMSNYKSLLLSLRRIVSEVQKKKTKLKTATDYQ